MVFLLDSRDPRNPGAGVANTGTPVAGANNPSLPGSPSSPDEPPPQGLTGPYFQPSSGSAPGGDVRSLRGNRLPLESADPDFNNMLKQSISRIISGRDVPYTPGVISKLKGNALAAARGQVGANVAAADRDSLQRGVYRSSIAADRVASANTQAAQAFTNATAEVDSTAALANYNARMEGLSKGREWLDSLSREIQARAGLNIGVDQLTSELNLAYQRLSSQERLQANDLLGAMERMLLGAGLEV